MIFDFKRYPVPETYYSDANLTIAAGDKYDLYEQGNLTGTLITSGDETYARFRDGGSYTRNTKLWGHFVNEHQLLNENGALFACITSDCTRYNRHKTMVVFTDDPYSYTLDAESFNGYKGRYNLTIGIKAHDQMVFKLNNIQEGNFWDRDDDRPWEGIIEMNDRLHRDKVFGFLLAIQLYYRTRYQGHSHL